MSTSKKRQIEVLPFEDFAPKYVDVLNGTSPKPDAEGIVRGLVLLASSMLTFTTELELNQHIAEVLYGAYDSDIWVIHKPFGTAVDHSGVVYSFELGRWSETLAFDEL